MTIARANLIERLQRKIHRLETVCRVDDGSVVRSGCPGIDQMLPEYGYKRGTLVEWFSPYSPSHGSGGFGADFISLRTAQKACEDGGALVIIDAERQFYPPAVAAMGINSGNLIVLRSSADTSQDDSKNELYWAVDQALRCPAVAAVWGPLDYIGERWFRRFQLAAESSGTLGLFVRPARALSRPSWAEVQWKLHRPPLNRIAHPDSRQLRLELLKCRGVQTGQLIDLTINTITGSVREMTRARSDYASKRSASSSPSKGTLSLAAQLAYPKTRRRTRTA